MELNELEDNLKIVFDKEESDQKEGTCTSFYTKSNNNLIFNYPNAETLVAMFSILGNDKKLQSFFITSLKKRTMDSEEILWGQRTGGFSRVGASPLCFYALVELGYTNEAIESLKKRHNGRYGIYSLICILLDKNYFDSNQLKEISNKINSDLEQHLSDIEESNRIGEILQHKLIQTRFERLRKQIKKVNIEINQDRRTVSEKINLLGLSENYNELLNCIDNFIQIETSKVVNAGMISALRTFMADLLKDIANRIAEEEHQEIPKINERGEMGNIRSYLKTKLELSSQDDKFVDSFIDILHAEGGHSFMSEKEYFRLSRNIAIEIALFILSKYEKKYKKS